MNDSHLSVERWIKPAFHAKMPAVGPKLLRLSSTSRTCWRGLERSAWSLPIRPASIRRYVFQHWKEFSRSRVEDRTIKATFKAATGRGRALDIKLFGCDEPSFPYKVHRCRFQGPTIIPKAKPSLRPSLKS